MHLHLYRVLTRLFASALLLGSFTSASAQCALQWVAGGGFGTGMGNVVRALTVMPNGDLVAAGDFLTAGGGSAVRVARWNGVAWSALGAGMNNRVLCLAALPNGDVVAGGIFTTAGGGGASFVARWDGASWLPVGGGMAGTAFGTGVYALKVLPNGDLVAGGIFATAGGVITNGIARWNGTVWSALGSGMAGSFVSNGVYAIDRLPNGELVAGGVFSTAGGVTANCIARWDGLNWWSLGPGVNSVVHTVKALANNDIVAGGQFTFAGGVPGANYIARWNGTSWSAFGSGLSTNAYSLLLLPNGDLVAGGQFTTAGGNSALRIARWNGTAWSNLGSTLGSTVLALTMLQDGDVVAGGSFFGAGANAIARLSSPCPATAIAHGTSCIGSAGPLVLTATALPWVGGVFRTTCTGMAANSLAASLLGFTVPGTPLSLLHPAGAPGCLLLASPDATLLLFPANGVATAQFAMPIDPAFVGFVLMNQDLQLELDASFQITALNGSNGLSLTIGAM